MFDREKALEKAQLKLQNQQAALKQTLDEIEFVEATRPTAVGLIKALRVKRDRQANTIKATEDLIEIYALPPAKPAKR